MGPVPLASNSYCPLTCWALPRLMTEMKFSLHTRNCQMPTAGCRPVPPLSLVPLTSSTTKCNFLLHQTWGLLPVLPHETMLPPPPLTCQVMSLLVQRVLQLLTAPFLLPMFSQHPTFWDKSLTLHCARLLSCMWPHQPSDSP